MRLSTRRRTRFALRLEYAAVPRATDLLIRVRAVGVNHGEAKIRMTRSRRTSEGGRFNN